MLRQLMSAALVVLSIGFGYGQKKDPTSKAPVPDASPLLSKRDEQIERLNNALLSEKPKLTSGERVSLYANLARIWKVDKPTVSKKFLKDAIDQASPALVDSRNEKDEKMASLRKLLPLSEQIDPTLTEQITRQLKAESEAQPGHRLQNSIAFTDAALAVVSTNPSLAVEMATAALQYIERPSENEKLLSVILFVARKDKKLSEDLLLRVFEFAKQVDDLQSIGSLALLTSPKSSTVEVDFLSDSSKKYVLSIFIDRLVRLSALAQQNQLSPEQRGQACRLNIVRRGLSPVISSYLPNQAPLAPQLDQLSSLCQAVPGTDPTQSLLDELSKSSGDLTLEELIQAGEDAANPQKKAFYFSLAVGKLGKEKKFERALELLDHMNEETKRAMGTDNDDSFWRATRQANALNAVLQRLETQDFGGASRLIEKTPTSLLPELEIQISQAILRKVSKADSSDPMQSFAFDLVNDARRKLPNMDDPFAGVNLYLGLVRRYATLLPDEAILVFQEAVKAINRADNAKDQEKNHGKDFAGASDIIVLPPELLEHEDVIGSYIHEVQKPYTRVRLRLGLLGACVTKYRDEKKQVAEKTL
jgi:hypothetical protein